MGDDLDNRALSGVKIDIIMGRNAGFLTAASALARVHPNDGPHLIYLPEKTNEAVESERRMTAVAVAASARAAASVAVAASQRLPAD